MVNCKIYSIEGNIGKGRIPGCESVLVLEKIAFGSGS